MEGAQFDRRIIGEHCEIQRARAFDISIGVAAKALAVWLSPTTIDVTRSAGLDGGGISFMLTRDRPELPLVCFIGPGSINAFLVKGKSLQVVLRGSALPSKLTFSIFAWGPSPGSSIASPTIFLFFFRHYLPRIPTFLLVTLGILDNLRTASWSAAMNALPAPMIGSPGPWKSCHS